MATGYVVYNGKLYEDADAMLKAKGATMEAKAGDSTSLVGVGINREQRKQNYIYLAKQNGWDITADLYATGKNNLTTFCNFFWFEPSKYIVKNPPKAKNVQPLKTITAAELCKKTEPPKSANKYVNELILAIDGAIDCRNAVNNRDIKEAIKAINEHSEFAGNALTVVRDDILQTLSNCANGIIDAFEKPFTIHSKNFVRFAEEARGGFKSLETIAKSAADISETLKKIDAKLGKLDTRQEEMNERLTGLAQIETGISANVAKMVTFVDRFTKR